MRVRSFLPRLTGGEFARLPDASYIRAMPRQVSMGRGRVFPCPLGEGGESASLDHFVRARDQRRRHGDTQCIGGFEIDRELELTRLFDRNIGDFDALSLTTKQASSSSSIVHGGGKRRGEGITKISRR